MADGPTPTGSRGRLARVPAAIGVVVLALAINAGLGSGLDALTGTHRPEPPAPTGVGEPVLVGDARWRAPAIRAEPWVHAYAAEVEALRQQYEPFLTFELQPAAGRWVNVQGGERRTWQAPSATAEPEVSLDGGSLAFGLGQRDEATVASDLARLAAADGLAIRVRNHGQPGWTLFQAMLAFERRTASGPPPLVAVFLGGAEDLAVQVHGDGRPSHLGYAGAHTAHAAGIGDALAQLVHEYARHSLANHATGAAVAALSERPGPVAVAPPVWPTAVGRRALSAWNRSADLAAAVGAAHGVATLFVLQPAATAAGGAYRVLADQAAHTVDLSRLLAQDPGRWFIDAGDVDERGAQLVAARLWASLRPQIAAWYRAHPR